MSVHCLSTIFINYFDCIGLEVNLDKSMIISADVDADIVDQLMHLTGF